MPQPFSSVWKPDLFTDKVVFCTGGSGSICSAQVRALVVLGANACIVGRNVEKTERVAREIELDRPGSRVLAIGNVDVRNVDSLQQAVTRCVNTLGGIDFLIAGAAGNFLAPISQLSPNAFKSVIDIDVLGCYNVTKLALPYLVAAAKKHNKSSSLSLANSAKSSGPAGRILYVSATIHYAGAPLQTHAVVAKAGIDALSANVAIEYGPSGVTSNVIAPGPIAGTQGMDRLSKEHYAGQPGGKQIPLGRWGTVEEIADATIFLFSDAANYVNGDRLVVDGGAWHTGAGTPGFGNFEYPDFLLSGASVTGVGGGQKTRDTNSRL